MSALHPIAEGALRFYLSREHNEYVLNSLFDMVHRLSPQEVLRVGADLMIVGRFLHAAGRFAESEALAERVTSAAQRATHRAGGLAYLAPEAKFSPALHAQTRAKFRPPADTSWHAPIPPLKDTLLTKWNESSADQRACLADLADSLAKRVKRS